ncbi:Lrp/AsnC ligand binding domain-containing protein [Speluncibacter jeojiensis]|uniref:Lrp/AsnC ligand binding domain-containing protein n=1 Tax=Speluncibacter jeojiensis TaxID=2710754 RepID=A0A9X4M433_9ACTN|nr:Lrp/AsnC ligand binding domain-containing protein [Corynebacteriales bacterium D3-21]
MVSQAVEAYILVQTDVGRAGAVADEIVALGGVRTAEVLTGPYDIIVRVCADSMDLLASNVIAPIQRVAGITRTLTCPIVTPPAATPQER